MFQIFGNLDIDESQVPGLVNPSMLKDGKDGTQRLNGTMRKKMGESIYHQLRSRQKRGV